jgi:RnfABCDGE-type electron transport complex B subunit
MDSVIINSAVIMGGLALATGLVLTLAAKRFTLTVDSRIDKIWAVLPQVNCGGCGYEGCMVYAEAVARQGAAITLCAPGAEKIERAIADIMSVESVGLEAKIAAVHCKGGQKETAKKALYEGVNDCRAAALIGGGDKICVWGCLGLGSCVRACPFDAIAINKNSVAVVEPKKCTGCGNCVEACPVQIIQLMPASAKIFLACSNHDRGSTVKEYCDVGCIACAQCVKATPSGALAMRNNLPLLDYTREENFVAAAYRCPAHCYTDLAVKRPKVSIDQKCIGCGECVAVCPVKAIEGKPKEKHKVFFNKCIGCGRCIDVCPVRAINLLGALGYRATETY